nr:unnamed protein product [Digitaria exilis]
MFQYEPRTQTAVSETKGGRQTPLIVCGVPAARISAEVWPSWRTVTTPRPRAQGDRYGKGLTGRCSTAKGVVDSSCRAAARGKNRVGRGSLTEEGVGTWGFALRQPTPPQSRWRR